MSHVTVESCGPWLTVQDGGRWGWEHRGMTSGGAIDARAWRLGHRLIGNDDIAAAIEIPWGNCAFRFEDHRRVAITGANVSISVDGIPQVVDTAFMVRPGTLLTLGRPAAGIWSYLHVEGGIALPPVLGSCATVVREGIGGLDGRGLQAGDQLPLGGQHAEACRTSGARPGDYGGTRTVELRFLPCFQYDDFADAARATLVGSKYRVSSRSDRMGCRLEGPDIETGISQLWSEGTCLGAIQVPPDGQPIVLLNDRQTMGGYPKAGAVLSVDCGRLAQLRTGTEVRFVAVSPMDADRILWLQMNFEREQYLPVIGTD